jgi:BirA family transcriptional regulator, biotin operon repressor / biotin---[acetyl-CoA-carboxylase] ligase
LIGFGRPRRHFRLTDSTNERARELAEGGAPHGTVVTAGEQTAGRGRGGRAWAAPPEKALLCSAILRPLDRRHRLLPLAVPLAVCEAVESVAPVSCVVKWPNDVWIDHSKVAGILIEARPPRWAVIGIGVNVSIEPDELPADLRWPAASVGHGVTLDATLATLTEGLGRWVAAPADRVLGAYRERDALRGRGVAWEGGPKGMESGRGAAAGVDESGDLLVRTEGGELVGLGAGEVSLTLE